MSKAAIRDLARGGLYLGASIVYAVSVLLAIVFLGTGIVGAIVWEQAGIGLVAYFSAIAAGILLIPISLILLGRWLHE